MAKLNYLNKPEKAADKCAGRRVSKDRKGPSITQSQNVAGFVEYMQYLQSWPRLFLTNFLAGVMRGVGFAVGFSILGAIVVMVVQRLALANLPGIGDFFAEIVRIVQMKIY